MNSGTVDNFWASFLALYNDKMFSDTTGWHNTSTRIINNTFKNTLKYVGKMNVIQKKYLLFSFIKDDNVYILFCKTEYNWYSKMCTLITFQVCSHYGVWFPLHSTWLENFEGLSSSLQMPELTVGLRLVILDNRVVLRRLLSESSFLKSVFIFMQQGRQCMKSCRRWPLKIMYIQGLQQLLRLASSAERVTAVFSESEEPRGHRKFRKHLVLTWLSIASSCNNTMINK